VEEFRFVARCLHGIEWVLAAEIEETFGVEIISTAHREVRFATVGAPPAPSLLLRTADDVFLTAGGATGIDHTRASLARLGDGAARLPWPAVIAAWRAIRPDAASSSFTVTASARGRRNYDRYEVEDRVAERIAPAFALPYRATRDSGGDAPGLAVRVHLVEDTATFALRVFDHPLHRREYKRHSQIGTLHPPLASAMAMVAGLRPGARVLDPFVGAGTVAIEARRLQPSAFVVGIDIDATRVADAARNAAGAHVRPDLLVADAGRLPFATATFDRVVGNAPWLVAVDALGELAGAPSVGRDSELARVLAAGGRAVLLVHENDATQLGGARRIGLEPRFRGWISVFGQYPRLCVVTGAGDRSGGAIDTEAPFGAALARNVWRADTREE
jgi:23S rRNA G2445 N2-methylase RlmL